MRRSGGHNAGDLPKMVQCLEQDGRTGCPAQEESQICQAKHQ